MAAGGTQVKAWHRHADGAVASPSSCDRVVFVLAWFYAAQWTNELARVTAVPQDLATSHSAVPAHLDLPYPLVDAVGEALRAGRGDLVPILVGQAGADVLVHGDALREPEAAAEVSAPHTESRGRLRILAAEVTARHTTDVRVVSWLLLADGWHSITPRHGDGARVTVRRVHPDGLADKLAPRPGPGDHMSDSDQPTTPPTRTTAAVADDKYDQMLALADLFDSSGNEMREKARLGAVILADDDVADSGELSRATYAQAEEDVQAATTGKHGLLTRSVELDADALVVRATVLTYRWIGELQQAAYKTLGSIAGRAISYLAPEVALGGAIVSAGLIETDALDRDGLTAY